MHGAHAVQMDLLELPAATPRPSATPTAGRAGTGAAKHVWGNGENGLMLPADNMLNDVTQNTDMIIHIGADLETTPWGFAGQFPSGVLFYWQELGKKQVFVSPDLNYSGAVHADKWIPILPNTDAALHLAIAYTWMTEGTYDKDYVATHVVGFDKFEDYVMGARRRRAQDSGVGVGEDAACPNGPSRRLAREWAKQPTTVMHFYGGSLRARTLLARAGPARSCLLGMQGLGKPGVHQYYKMGGDDHWMNDTPAPIRPPTCA